MHSQITEMMISHLCHELAGPIGAVANGIELANEIGGDILDEAMSMANISSVELVSRMKFYRIAYGVVATSSTDFTEFYNIANDFLNSKKTKLHWLLPKGKIKLNAAEYKLILNMIALVNMAVIEGGEIKVNIEDNNFIVSLYSDNLSSIENLITAMDKNISIETLTPYNIHGYWTAYLARQLVRDLCHSIGLNKIIFTA